VVGSGTARTRWQAKDETEIEGSVGFGVTPDWVLVVRLRLIVLRRVGHDRVEAKAEGVRA
jgi:hypothetical protein